jgi:two-component system chemotaxis response regulator CheB
VKRIRVVVADDSAFMRGAIARLLGSDERFEIVGQAKDGAEAVRMAGELRPDAMTMDFNMPGLNGAEATRHIMKSAREAGRAIGIVMLSAHTAPGARETIEALSAGAFDFVPKPGGEVVAQLGSVRDELVQKLVAASKARVTPQAEEQPSTSRRPVSRPLAPLPVGHRLIVIAASTGGPAALERVVSALPDRQGASIVIVQHMPSGYTRALAERLDQLSPWTVREAVSGDRLQSRHIYVAPGGQHLEVERSGFLRTTDAPPMHGVRPAGDVTLRSAALAFGARVAGIVMTGMGRDGATGLAAIKSAGGVTLAQDAATSTVFGMPKAAVELGVVDHMIALGDIAGAIDRLTRD